MKNLPEKVMMSAIAVIAIVAILNIKMGHKQNSVLVGEPNLILVNEPNLASLRVLMTLGSSVVYCLDDNWDCFQIRFEVDETSRELKSVSFSSKGFVEGLSLSTSKDWDLWLARFNSIPKEKLQ